MSPEETNTLDDFLRRLSSCDHADRLVTAGNWISAAQTLGLHHDSQPEVVRQTAIENRQFVDQLADLRQDRDFAGYWEHVRQRLTVDQWDTLQDYLARRNVMLRALELAEADKLDELLSMFRVDSEEKLRRSLESYGEYLAELSGMVDDADSWGYRLMAERSVNRSGVFFPEPSSQRVPA